MLGVAVHVRWQELQKRGLGCGTQVEESLVESRGARERL
jgi:hypothetical protein